MKIGLFDRIAFFAAIGLVIIGYYQIGSQLKLVTNQQKALVKTMEGVAENQRTTMRSLAGIESRQLFHGKQITGILESVIGLEVQFKESSEVSSLVGPVTIPEKIEEMRKGMGKQQLQHEEISSALNELNEKLSLTETHIEDIKTDVAFLKIRAN